MSQQALAVVQPEEIEQRSLVARGQNEVRSLEDIMRLGDVFAKSGYFSDARDAAKAVVKILAGQDMGISPFAAMNGIFLNSQGKIGYAANLIAAQIKNSGKYDYRIRNWDDDGCKIEFFERGQSVGFGEFDREDAVRAGLAGKDTYKSYPKALFFARALTQGARAYTPELFGGNAIYTPEELGDDKAQMMPRADNVHFLDGQTPQVQGETKPQPDTRTVPSVKTPASAIASPEEAELDKLLTGHCIGLKGNQKAGEAYFKAVYGKKSFEEKQAAALDLKLVAVEPEPVIEAEVVEEEPREQVAI